MRKKIIKEDTITKEQIDNAIGDLIGKGVTFYMSPDYTAGKITNYIGNPKYISSCEFIDDNTNVKKFKIFLTTEKNGSVTNSIIFDCEVDGFAYEYLLKLKDPNDGKELDTSKVITIFNTKFHKCFHFFK